MSDLDLPDLPDLQESPRIIPENLSDVMRRMFLDYSLSVITDRSFPDVRDGLKPVHRRILFSMMEIKNHWNTKYRKSARIVGDVIGKYHPHGDVAAYEAMVRMAQDFSLLHPLVDGQGNFGSVDGDSAAAMRYTEVRLSRLSDSLLSDASPYIIPYVPNYDGELMEPRVLPAGFPNLVINGVDGIAVGMATYIPPHNMADVIKCVHLLSADPQTPAITLFETLRAPDFPTGGVVYNTSGLLDAIETGRGTVRVRSKWTVEPRSGGRSTLVITEIPYQVVKKKLVEDTQAYLRERAKSKEFTDVTEIRDESDKDGMRIAIDLKAGVDAEPVFAMLAAKLEYDVSYGYNCMALLPNGKPELLSIRRLLLEWMAFRREVIANRLRVELHRQKARLHILEGYRIALSRVDEVVIAIRNAPSTDVAMTTLQTMLQIDAIQARSILDLRLQRLAAFEVQDILDEHARGTAEVARLQGILGNPSEIERVMLDELDVISERFGQPRRTEIGEGLSTITREEMIPVEDVIVTVTRSGYIKRMPAETFEAQRRGTRGRKSIEVEEGDEITLLYHCSSHDVLLLFTASGQAHGVKAWRIPEGSFTSRGNHLRRVFDDFEGEVQSIVVVPEDASDKTVMTITSQGQVKRTEVSDYAGAQRRGGVRGVNLEEGDTLVSTFIVGEHDHIILVNDGGLAIRFPASDVRPTGRATGGVRGMKLAPGLQVIGADCVRIDTPLALRNITDDEGNERTVPDTSAVDAGRYLLCIGDKGVGKRTPLQEFSVQSRAGKGVIAFKQNTKTGKLIAALGARADMDVIMMASNGVSNRMRMESIRETGRSASGVYLMNLDKGATLIKAVSVVGTPEASPLPDAEAVSAPSSDSQQEAATLAHSVDPEA